MTTAAGTRRLVLAESSDPMPPTVHTTVTGGSTVLATSGVSVGAAGSASNVTQHGSRVMEHLTVSSLSFTTALPLLGVGLVTLMLSLCFCCYLWKLKREAHCERGYSQLKYYSRSKKVKNDMCPVCLEEFSQAEKVAVSHCHHGFHTKCLQQWLNQHNTCPMCKAPVSATGQAGERTGLITSNV